MTTQPQVLKQWELPHNSIVILPNGTKATYIKMDGMYATWENAAGEPAIGNYEGFIRIGNEYKVV